MRIDDKLNLVVPLERDDDRKIYVHSTPISRETFERYFLVVSKTFAAMFQQGVSVVAGPRVAMLMLKKVAMDMGDWEGPDGVELGLVAEMRRLTNVVVPTETGWRAVPMDDAVARGLVDPEEADEVEGIVAFFTAVSATMRRSQRGQTLTTAGGLWRFSITSSGCAEFVRGLPTSTATATTPPAPAASSLPS